MYDFHKYHALGNDYIVIDPRENQIVLNEEKIRLICHRNYGIGSDGILYGPVFREGNIHLQILNPDGSEAEKSGNGVRIFARYLHDAGDMKEKVFNLQTLGGMVGVEYLREDASLIKVNMGKAVFQSNLIPVKGEPREVVSEDLAVNGRVYQVTCVSMGNPHCVIPLPEISRELVVEIGPAVENHLVFPNRINLQIMQVIDRNNIRIEIWERGAGYTLASGSSSCAAACAARKLGLVADDLKVQMPGGTIEIQIEPDWTVHMTGSVSGVARGEFAAEFRQAIQG